MLEATFGSTPMTVYLADGGISTPQFVTSLKRIAYLLYLIIVWVCWVSLKVNFMTYLSPNETEVKHHKNNVFTGFDLCPVYASSILTNNQQNV